MDIHKKSKNLSIGLQTGILRKFVVCIRLGRSAPPPCSNRVNGREITYVYIMKTKNLRHKWLHFYFWGQHEIQISKIYWILFLTFSIEVVFEPSWRFPMNYIFFLWSYWELSVLLFDKRLKSVIIREFFFNLWFFLSILFYFSIYDVAKPTKETSN